MVLPLNLPTLHPLKFASTNAMLTANVTHFITTLTTNNATFNTVNQHLLTRMQSMQRE
jgi:hypothetical protein